MTNICENILKIQSNDSDLLLRIHNMFIEEEDGEVSYTMNKLIPIFNDIDTDEPDMQNSYNRYFLWGAESDFLRPEMKINSNHLSFSYRTSNMTNEIWIVELISYIKKLIADESLKAKPEVSLSHYFFINELGTSGFGYTDSEMGLHFERFERGEENPKHKNEIEELLKECRSSQDLLEFFFDE